MSNLTFHHKVTILQACLLLISFVFQLLAVLSVPITSRISLCTYNGYKFGVFGLCDAETCTDIRIGYRPSEIAKFSGFTLPSNARHSISYLLVVHPLAAGFTLVLFCMTVMSFHKKLSSSSQFYLLILLWTLPTFLFSLLAFLVDILLFIPHLDWFGWTILASTVLIASCGTMMCIMRRTTLSRRDHVLVTGNDKDLYMGALSYDDEDDDSSSSSYSETVGDSTDNLLGNTSDNTNLNPQIHSFFRPDAYRGCSQPSLAAYQDPITPDILPEVERTLHTGPDTTTPYLPPRIVSHPVTSIFVSDPDDELETDANNRSMFVNTRNSGLDSREVRSRTSSTAPSLLYPTYKEDDDLPVSHNRNNNQTEGSRPLLPTDSLSLNRDARRISAVSTRMADSLSEIASYSRSIACSHNRGSLYDQQSVVSDELILSSFIPTNNEL
ncbi:hypothetical protein CANARDRAFT_26786 [[Candida] arabinofermentans NRRL YB-2248]|uniref:PH-response regulator protein palI/RIM9 n=1 Tax=[Candida] arabinofermentans NRRL YB-2248 TaxID=983967 RepID=A0A1E4T6M6_9ASCO|nr:hypothetical protein CANARDRAFT_26786 [[Candida] arabinofermentans NRRL YB-2248]